MTRTSTGGLHSEHKSATLLVIYMNNVNILQNVVIDRCKIATIIKDTKSSDLKKLLNIKNSQVTNLRRGDRGLSANGLLRLMIMYDIKPDDLAIIVQQSKTV